MNLTADIHCRANLRLWGQPMPSITELAAWEGIILLIGFCGVIFWKLATGDISLEYLLYGDARGLIGGGSRTFFSPGRAQMLMVTITAAIYYLLQVIQNPTKFPDVPNGLIAAVGGSHTVYLTGKLQSLYLGQFRDFVARFDRRSQ